MSKKKRSVFTILLLRIIILVIIFNVVIAILVINEIANIQKRKIENIHKNNQSDITGLMDSWNAVLKSMDDIFQISIENALLKIIDINAEQDLGTADLYRQMELSGLDTSYVDFVVINDSIVVNTTCPSLLGLNVDSAEIVPVNLLSKLNGAGRSVIEPWTLDLRTGRFKSRGYIATGDNKYIVRAECYSKLAEELVAMFASRIKRVTKENENILAVNFYIGDEYRHFCLTDDTINYEWHDSSVSQAFTGKADIKRIFSEGEKTAIIDYVFKDSGNQKWSSANFVFSVVTEFTDPEIQLYEILKAQAIILLSFLILLFIIFMFTIRKPRKTIKDLRLKATLIANGKPHERVIVAGQNEFSALAEQFNSMVEQLDSSQNELKQKNEVIGKNYKTLHEKNEEITKQRDQIESQRDLVTKQKDKILEQKRSITESIQYARQIQTAILPPDEVIKYLLPKHFILYRPRDIVSGDFYWLTHKHGEIIIVVADCTGHGVPGAFMSVLGSALLKDVISGSDILKANQILNDLREKVILSLRQTGKEGEAKDGMDISLCIINTEKMSLQYAGANIPLYLVRQDRLKEIKADRMPIGISSKAGNSFTNHVMKIYKNDSIYLFTDGYVDQFGGENGRKFLSKQFKELILEVQNKIMIDQKEILNQRLNEWMGLIGQYQKHEQVDDITIMGINI